MYWFHYRTAWLVSWLISYSEIWMAAIWGKFKKMIRDLPQVA